MCRAAYMHEHYVANRERYLLNTGRRRRQASVERMCHLLAFFETHPCVDCGETDACVLEFDHLGDKSFNISEGYRDRTWEIVLTEMAKCEVRCSNCHKRRTAATQGWVRDTLAQRPPSGPHA